MSTIKNLIEQIGDTPTDILEDLYYLIGATLQERDRAEIEKGLK